MNATGIELTKRAKWFLEAAQPLPVRYSYSKGVVEGDSFVSYQTMNSTYRVGIGNELMSERLTVVATVQTKTAEQNIIFSELIKRRTDKTGVVFVSDSPRRDSTVKDGWINTIILYVYDSLDVPKDIYTRDEVRKALQEIADNYIFVTSIYAQTLAQSFIDSYVVPELEKDYYSEAEFLALKQEYLDRVLLTTTQY